MSDRVLSIFFEMIRLVEAQLERIVLTRDAFDRSRGALGKSGSFFHSFIHSFILHSFIRPFVHLAFIHSFIHSFISAIDVGK